eukprot:2409845-Rhodomonas_salina.1
MVSEAVRDGAWACVCRSAQGLCAVGHCPGSQRPMVVGHSSVQQLLEAGELDRVRPLLLLLCATLPRPAHAPAPAVPRRALHGGARGVVSAEQRAARGEGDGAAAGGCCAGEAGGGGAGGAQRVQGLLISSHRRLPLLHAALAPRRVALLLRRLSAQGRRAEGSRAQGSRPQGFGSPCA